MNPVAKIHHVTDGDDTYDAIWLWCPGCAAQPQKSSGLHSLPVTGDGSKRPTWDWNGELEAVTLNPSILTHFNYGDPPTAYVCHSYLRNGQWEFLTDSTHDLAGKKVPMGPLPDWIVRPSRR